jgi:hypothetical protein
LRVRASCCHNPQTAQGAFHLAGVRSGRNYVWGSGRGFDDDLAFRAQVSNEVLDLGRGQNLAVGRHDFAPVVDLFGDFLWLQAGADELEVGSLASAHSGGAVAVGAATFREDFGAARLRAGTCRGRYRGRSRNHDAQQGCGEKERLEE